MPVGRVAVDDDRAGGLKPYLVGAGQQVILFLGDVGPVRQHLLAGGTELAQRRGHRLELGQPATGQLARIEHDGADPRVLAGGTDRVGQVLDQRFRAGPPVGLADGAIDRVTGQLLDQPALGTDQQRGMARQHGGCGMERRPDDREQREHQDQVQEFPDDVERRPEAAEKT